MDRTLSNQGESVAAVRNRQPGSFCLPLLKPINPHCPNLCSLFTDWVSKSLRRLCCRGKIFNGCCCRRFQFSGMVVNNSMNCDSPRLPEAELETVGVKAKRGGTGGNRRKIRTFAEVIEEPCRDSCSSSDFMGSEVTVNDEHSSSEDSSSPPSLGWPIQRSKLPDYPSSDVSEEVEEPCFDDRIFQKQGSLLSEIELMKERFSKLLLGEDMSGCGNGVCTALAISNAITNLCATVFGQIWRLEPLSHEKKTMWRREMEWLLCVSDHIVELIPSWQTFPDGSKLEVMACRPRTDLYINLPALRKLDNMLLEILDSFDDTQFWYVDEGILALDADDGSSSIRKPIIPREEGKWWLPVPQVPTSGLAENERKQLHHKRDCTNQILKAAMAINGIALDDMEVPESYLEALPKNGRTTLGDVIYRYITSDQFSPECLLAGLDLSSEHQALEIANRVEASIHVWRRRINSNHLNGTNRSNSKSSWEMVKELVLDAEKRDLLAERAESLLLCLKQRFPGLPQTTLDMSKIQYNKDVGKSILESYSRVLESLAFNITARIDDLLHADYHMNKHSDEREKPLSKVGVMARRSVGVPYPTVPNSSTSYKTAFTTPSFSPPPLISRPGKGERSPSLSHAGLVLTDHSTTIDTKGKEYSHVEKSSSASSTVQDESKGSFSIVSRDNTVPEK